MTTDHKEQAGNLLASIHLDTDDVHEQTPKTRALRLELAQVHATLHAAAQTAALVEQQRVANRIAYLAIAESRGAADAAYRTLDLSVRDGLGLA